ncbi:MAG: C10 family peptidase [Bacteroidaceae bacterium]
METYKEAIKDLMASPEKSLPVIKEVTTRTNTSVAPLLGQIAWKQGDPCNQMCPMDGSRRSLTGCVATAMAQIMKYHRWPVTGTGSYHYNASLTVDFSQSTYQWDLMLDNYDGYSTSFSKEAVALLMRDCGMGSHTQYSYNNSSATFYDAKNAFKNHFGYDTQNLQVRDRRNDSYDWTNWIKADLNNNLPVCYGGKKGGGGHAFVCDGYDTNNLFHINWGWGGNSNGYFSLDELNGYTDGQQIITGIQKPGGTPPPPAEPYKLTYTSVLGPDKWSIYSGEEITFTIKIRNAGGEYNGQAKLACKQNGNEISSFTQDLVIAKGEEKTITLTKRLTLSPGSYKAYVYVYDQKENEPWFTLKPFNYSNCTFTVAEGTSIDSPDYSTLSIYPNPATSKLGILTNDNVKFIRVTDLTGKAMLTLSPSQEEKEISISIDELNAGTYLLQVTTDNGIKTSKFIKQ